MTENTKAVECRELHRHLRALDDMAAGKQVSLLPNGARQLADLIRHLAQPAVPEGVEITPAECDAIIDALWVVNPDRHQDLRNRLASASNSTPQPAAQESEAKSLQQRADAWDAIVGLLDELSPGWEMKVGTGVQCALAAIRHLAQPAVAESVAALISKWGRRYNDLIESDLTYEAEHVLRCCSELRDLTASHPDTAQGERGAVDACARVSAFVTEYRRRIAANPRGGMDPEDVYSLGMAGDPLVLRISDLAALATPTGDHNARAVTRHLDAAIDAVSGEHAPLTINDLRLNGAPAPVAQAGDGVAVPLADEDVQWIVNDIAELGVKIGDQFFFLYKGRSLVYEDAKHDDGSPMHWRPVFKREFGECCHPVNYADPSRIGTVSLSDSDDWQPLRAALARTQENNNG